MSETRGPPSDPDGVEVVTSDAEATRNLGRALAEAALAYVHDDGGCVVALCGDLGSGKTMFVKGVGDGLGIGPDAVVVSPTFTIARSLSFSGPPEGVLHHVDAYRLRGVEDLDAVGFEEMWGTGAFTCVEWAERVAEALPEDRISVCIEATAADTRAVRIAAHGVNSRAVVLALCDARGLETA